MGAARKDIVVEKGATFTYPFQVQNGDGTAFNLTGYTGQAEIRETVGNTQKLIATITCTIASPTSGNVVLSIPATTTVGLRDGVFEWDFFIRATSPETRLLAGKATIVPSVSKRA